MVAEIARRLQAGLEPDAVAARVLEAIRSDELYVFTHPDMRGGVDERFAAIHGGDGQGGQLTQIHRYPAHG